MHHCMTLVQNPAILSSIHNPLLSLCAATSTAAPIVGASGGTIAGSFIAVIIGLVVAVLVVAIAIWLYRRHYKKTYDVL